MVDLTQEEINILYELLTSLNYKYEGSKVMIPIIDKFKALMKPDSILEGTPLNG